MSDLINRDAFITYLKTAKASAYLNELADCDTEEAKWRIDDEMYYSTQSFIDVLKCRPTVDAVPVTHGNWIKATGVMPPECFGRYVCSICDNFAPNEFHGTHEWLSPICPHCGAKMMDEEGGQGESVNR